VSDQKIQRWECETNEFGDSDMQKNIIGNYVRYEDYVRLKAENARLKGEIDRLTYVDDFIVIQRASVVSIQEVFGPEDVSDIEGKWRYFIRVNKAEYDKVLKHMEEFWSAKEGKAQS
jgi:hypothetical protein